MTPEDQLSIDYMTPAEADYSGARIPPNQFAMTGEPPTFKDTFVANWRQETVLGSYGVKFNSDIELESTPEEEAALDSGEWDYTTGLEEDDPLLLPENRELAMQAKNERQRNHIRDIIDQRDHDLTVFQEAGLIKNILAGGAVLPFDATSWPFLFLPGIQGKLVARLGKGAALAGTDQAVREWGIHQFQDTRTINESLDNIGITTVFGSAFAGLLGGRVRPDLEGRALQGTKDILYQGEEKLGQALDQNVTKKYRELYGEDPLDWDSGWGVKLEEGQVITSGTIDDIIQVNPNLKAKMDDALAKGEIDQGTYNKQMTELQGEALRVRNEGVLRKMYAKLSKQGKLILSNSPTAKLFAYTALEAPHVGKYFDQGTVGHAVLTQQEALSGKMMATVRDAIKRGAKQSVKERGGGWWEQQRATIYGDEELDEAIAFAMNNGDKHPTNQLAEDIAKQIREATNDINKVLIETNQLQGNVKTGEVYTELVDRSHFHRVYDIAKITDDQRGFIRAVTEGIKKQVLRDVDHIDTRLGELQKQNKVKLKEFKAKLKGQKLTDAEKADALKREADRLEEEMTTLLEKEMEPMHMESRQRVGEADEAYNARIEETAYKVFKKLRDNTDEMTTEFDLMDLIGAELEKQAKPGFLKGRSLRVKYEDISDYLVKDVVSIMDTVARRGAGAGALAQRFGSANRKDIVKRIRAEYAALRYKASAKEKTRLQNEEKDIVQEVEHAWDALSGKNPQRGDRAKTTREVTNFMKNLQVVTKLGSSGLSAIEDFAALFLHLGHNMVIRAVDDMLSGGEVHAMTKQMLRDLNTGYEHVVADAASQRAGIDPMPKRAMASHLSSVMASRFLKVTGMPLVDKWSKQLVQYSLLSRLVRQAKKGGKFSKHDTEVMRQFGMNDEMMARVINNMRKHGKSVKDSGYEPYLDKWDDRTRMDLEFTLDRAARQVISTPNIGNQPTWMNDPVFSLALQFKSHMLGTMDNHLVPMIQRMGSRGGEQQFNTLLFLTAGYMLTSMNYNIRMALSGHEADNSVGNLSREFITRTSGLGMWGSVFGAMDEKFGLMEKAGIAEGAPSMFMTRSLLGHILGPAPGYVDDTMKFGQGLMQYLEDGTMKRGHINAGVRLLPGQNWLPIRYPVNLLKEEAAQRMAE